ncbi:MAG: MazG family protein, partial [Thermocrispum sp.]
MGNHGGSVVVILTAAGVPAAALAAVRAADVVYAAHGVDLEATGSEPAPEQPELVSVAAHKAVVLLAADAADPAAVALAAAGVPVIEQPVRPLLRAVDVMDRLRSPGGCPWDAEQTHESLRRYLVEETYELLDAIESGDRGALLEELGDVLLQVLFHARVAAEHPDEPFDVDDVAAELVDKLVSRHPHVFGSGEAVRTAEAQEQRWQQLKHAQQRRESIVDGVALGQPAAALAGKLAQRTAQLDLPDELLDRDELFLRAALTMRAGIE